jgi:hypothetical protein
VDGNGGDEALDSSCLFTILYVKRVMASRYSRFVCVCSDFKEGTGMKEGVMEVVTVVQVLTEKDSAGKDCSSKREDSGTLIGRTRTLLALYTTARYFA